MPRPKSGEVPKYRKHKASGQAVVKLNGRMFYLGPHGTETSKREYDRLVAEWLANGRTLPADERDEELTVGEVALAYLQFAKQEYRRGDGLSGEFDEVRLAIRAMNELYAELFASDFGPLRLRVVRDRMIESGTLSRNTINKRIRKIVACFRWAAGRELIEPSVPAKLETLDNLRRGRSAARETKRIPLVPDSTIDATTPHLPAVVADMVALQRVTGMRPAEVCAIRPVDIDRSGDVWIYRPEHHKNEHRDQDRFVPIGARGQAILLRYLAREATMHCFRPCDSEAKRRAERHAERTTPLSCGNRPGSSCKPSPKRTAGEAYTSDSYRRAIHRACDVAFPPAGELARLPGETVNAWERRIKSLGRLAEQRAWQSSHRWSPNRLRKTLGEEVRTKFGIDHTQAILGHKHAKTSEIYAQVELEKGVRVAREIG